MEWEGQCPTIHLCHTVGAEDSSLLPLLGSCIDLKHQSYKIVPLGTAYFCIKKWKQLFNRSFPPPILSSGLQGI